ncbi:hypothetical protein N231010_194 [Synechococcus phage S-CAM4]|uniref:Uncharacterized protein n=1 Tax=Synechococcus phage S-CAM4 TaxID=1883367 RepID=A0A1D8KMK1_9CAUD|nr:hypothetical protein N231010_194 [Synechococcus phage S-CAM4]
MAIVFPASPSTNDTFTAGSITYKWDGAKWIGLGVTPADRLVEGSNSLEITAGNDLIWTGDNVGIQNTSPDEALEVGAGTVDGGLKVSGQSSSVTSDGLTVDWESSSNSTRIFSEPQSGGSSQYKIYTTDSGTRARAVTITSAGEVQIADGNLKFSTAGTGIDFSADGNAAGMTSELLDDYEEGTWTPGITFGGSGAGITYSIQEGSYTKVGRFVTCYGVFVLTNNGTGTGGANITGLPFTVGNYLPSTGLEGGGLFTYQFNVGGTMYGPMTIMPSQSGTNAAIYRAGDTAGTMSGADDTNITNSFDCRFTFTYQTT